MTRKDGRSPEDLRPIEITRNVLEYAEGSCLISVGKTKVLCAVSLEDKTPQFLKGTGVGWLTAEYGMIPRSTRERKPRERVRLDGRSVEIQRLVGRALRPIIDLNLIGERTLTVDIDVIQADGGTRTAGITGAFVALVDAIRWLKKTAVLPLSVPIVKNFVAAVSVAVLNGEPALDPDYEEDCNAQADYNLVMTDSGQWIEIQGTAEHAPISSEVLMRLLDLGRSGIVRIIEKQKAVLGFPQQPLP
jgi:ribonuclease PH